MRNRASSLFWRLMAAISAVLLVGAGALAFAAYSYARRAADDAYDRLLLGAASQISETVRVVNGTIATDIPASALDSLSVSRIERVYYHVQAPDGVSLTGYDDLTIPAEFSKPGPAPQFWDTRFKGRPIRAAAVWRQISDPALTGWASVTVAQTTDARVALARDLTLRAMLLVWIMSLVALAGAGLAARYALRPLHRIEAALGTRDPNDLTPLDVQAPAEIEELAQSINRFMQRLSGRMEGLQSMIADAAHQIRTPITALTAQVELLKRETVPARRKHRLERVAARTSQIGRLVSQLLSHAMVSHRGHAITASAVDLEGIVRQAVADAIPAAMDRDISVEIDVRGALATVEGDAVSLREAVRNIVENAVHHGAPTKICVVLKKSEKFAVVEIGDDGPGIPRNQWPNVTRRFFRATSEGSGSGLGLAIAADVAASHGSALEFEHGADGLFKVRIALALKPVARP